MAGAALLPGCATVSVQTGVVTAETSIVEAATPLRQASTEFSDHAKARGLAQPGRGMANLVSRLAVGEDADLGPTYFESGHSLDTVAADLSRSAQLLAALKAEAVSAAASGSAQRADLISLDRALSHAVEAAGNFALVLSASDDGGRHADALAAYEGLLEEAQASADVIGAAYARDSMGIGAGATGSA